MQMPKHAKTKLAKIKIAVINICKLIQLSAFIYIHCNQNMLIPSSHRRRIDGELNRQAKRRQSITKLNKSVKTITELEKALSNSGHSASAPKNFKLFKNLRRTVTN